jgi:hypothetical protein
MTAVSSIQFFPLVINNVLLLPFSFSSKKMHKNTVVQQPTAHSSPKKATKKHDNQNRASKTY